MVNDNLIIDGAVESVQAPRGRRRSPQPVENRYSVVTSRLKAEPGRSERGWNDLPCELTPIMMPTTASQQKLKRERQATDAKSWTLKPRRST